MQTRVVFLDGASRYLEQGMAEVQGWLTPCSASIIAHLSAHQLRLGLSGNVAEIGVHHGKLFILLANLIAPDEAAYAVDIFDDQHKNVDRSGKGDRAIFEENVRKFATHAKVVVIQESSLDLEGTDFTSTSFRMISVDGGHTGPITCSDLHLSEKQLVDGGIVVLDDILNPDWTGVITGLVKYFSEGGALIPFALSANKLYLTTGREAAVAYASNLRASFPMALSKRSVEFFGFTVDVFTEHPYYDRSGQAGLRKRVDDMHREVVAIQRMNQHAADQVSAAQALVGSAGRELEAVRAENQSLKDEIHRLRQHSSNNALLGSSRLNFEGGDGSIAQ
ncbi:class I SAM-dependent methyltransferase [Burkholderia vietnamiensis]|uniref:class I SAM-dependent methyltransferase n=1 Tax=Burkholderia vietnamiensis TaxID=60552 RepID=UPI000A46BB6F|nr:class I SAM-dependent methyltransferase [Burkholderia vietnamiensis]MDN7411440.1 class I SAM-dependent methyltransferase [Burkholderia vietnamiensis]HDR9022683.1 class I SAM-dependent methyltransferase [Burkholderia vietnamiensis]HDR9199270.1 class I SAM-dependent methyltransferase [Burkholderia vietnamiensis]HEF4837297.1 class I SAM-dependent methyltransferase [Burkholderia vietnamiensis]